MTGHKSPNLEVRMKKVSVHCARSPRDPLTVCRRLHPLVGVKGVERRAQLIRPR